ncbi:hypothetical protein, partial [Streptomyces griseiscabiei]|uniref:hypothetical protein n=1 Tax=Streptomyces griseiscabiei TaxID=2993540 RepID=UPI001C4F7E0A
AAAGEGGPGDEHSLRHTRSLIFPLNGKIVCSMENIVGVPGLRCQPPGDVPRAPPTGTAEWEAFPASGNSSGNLPL